MDESEFNIDIVQTEDETKKTFELEGDFNQSVAPNLLTFLLGNALCKEEIIFDFKKTSDIDLSCLQIIASTILERNDKGYQSGFDVEGNEYLSIFFSKTGTYNFLSKITNKP
ncbi:MAG: hypothetical protein GXO88_02395 [Chlorobi bacterium]|nr:hypothetical protein [Chlorobiota bacterium]